MAPELTKTDTKYPEVSDHNDESCRELRRQTLVNEELLADLRKYLILSAEIVERATRIELVTSSLGSWHSTAELRPLAL